MTPGQKAVAVGVMFGAPVAAVAAPFVPGALTALNVTFLSNAPAVNQAISDFFLPFANAGRIPTSEGGDVGWITNYVGKKLGYIESPHTESR